MRRGSGKVATGRRGWWAAVGPWVTAAGALAAAPGAIPSAEPAAATADRPMPASVVNAFDGQRLDRIDGVVESAIAEGKMPGCVICIGRRDGIALLRAYGRRQVEPEAEAMTIDTVFDLASLTKPVATATAVMQLLEDGRLRLADPVADLLPAFAARGKEKITVHDLLTHQSGLIADNPLADYQDGRERSLARICDLEPLAAPGERFIYSDVNFILLGELVERLGGQPLAEATAARIYRPLGMTETGYRPDPSLHDRCAPTERRDGRWIRGEVHDPRAWQLGGVAGHAGLFGTAADLARYARMMLSGGTLDGVRVLAAPTVALMTRAAPVPDGGLRGLGWDIRSRFSSNRGDLMSEAAFGHGGFTGTALWIDPRLDLFVIFLSNRVHPDGKGMVNPLIGRIGGLAVAALTDSADGPVGEGSSPAGVLCGIDVLVRDHFRRLEGRRIGLITNHTGKDRSGVPTGRLLADAAGVELVALFSPEHGLTGRFDQAEVPDALDEVTGRPVRSLYGKTRRPTAAMLSDVDTLVFDIQDIGTRFYTYISTLLEAMRAAAEHDLRLVVLDRPNPIGGVDVAGPLVDAGRESFVGCHAIPLRHGMTVGELATLFRDELGLTVDLEVVPCEGWRRGDVFDATGLEWVDPSPNMRSLPAAYLYPGIGLLEMTNLSVGRGTDAPFERFGAPWLDARRLDELLALRRIPGVAFMPVTFTPSASKFAGQSCHGLALMITDRDRIDPVRVGLEIATALRRLHPEEWQAEKLEVLLLDRRTLEAVLAGDIDAALAAAATGPAAFSARRVPHLRYPR
jgi:uncharacterized protein YbbC (DUF1343 family)/CubicO group peptidase (beta-lactamase class C family)